jgi:hypothetical protein
VNKKLLFYQKKITLKEKYKKDVREKGFLFKDVKENFIII